jgi:hypothetical protein
MARHSLIDTLKKGEQVVYAFHSHEYLVAVYKNIQKSFIDFMTVFNYVISEYEKCQDVAQEQRGKYVAATTEEKQMMYMDVAPEQRGPASRDSGVYTKEQYFVLIAMTFEKMTPEERTGPEGSALFAFLSYNNNFEFLTMENPHEVRDLLMNVKFKLYKDPVD